MQKNKLHYLVPFFALMIIFIIDLIFIVSIHWQWNNTMKKYIPLQNEMQLLKSNVSTAHLWLEEAIGGDTYIDIEKDVMIPFQHASFNAYVKNSTTVFDSEKDEFFLTELKVIDTKLNDLYTVAKLRWDKSGIHGIGSSLDQEFDKEFNVILKQIDTVSSKVNQKLSEELEQRSYYFSWIITLFLLVNFIVFMMLYLATRRQRTYQLSLSEEKERAIVTLKSIGDAVITTDVQGNITLFNNVAEELTEYTNEEVQGLPIDSVLKLYNTKTGEKIIPPIHDVLEKGITKVTSNGTKLVNKTGKEYILSDSAAPVMSKEGEILGTVFVFQNDTKRNEMEKNVRESEAKYRSLVESTKHHYLFYTQDNSGVITYVSNSLFEVLGYDEEEFKTHYREFITDDPINAGFEEFRLNCLAGKTQKSYTLSIYHKNGSVRYHEVVATPVFDNDGNVVAIDGIGRDVTDNYIAQKHLKEQQELLSHKAHHDSLTNLPNRQLFLDRLAQSIRYAQRFDNKVAVLFIDLDHFKEINDSLGHHVGDEVLKIVSNTLQKQIRKTDTLARLGGDEFIIILDTLDDVNFIVDMIKKLMDAMNAPILVGDHQLYLTLSIGVSLYPEDGDVSEDLLRNADAAMYNAKNNGRNTYCFYTEEMTQKAFERIEMEASLRQALEREEFVVYYHPQVDALTGNVVGVEALIRWNHPDNAMIPPMKFIPLAEEIGLIIPIDQWVMKVGMIQLVQWYNAGLKPGRLALNLSIKQLRQIDFIDTVSTLLKETGCKPEWLAFEVTETQIMKNPDQSILLLQRLSDMGIELALDDFGTGYSSLAYLKRLPIDKLKIDMSFVEGLPHNKEDGGIVKALIILSKSLELDIIAEGVETPEQKRFLVDNGCSHIQGYLYSKPISSVDMEKMLKDI